MASYVPSFSGQVVVSPITGFSFTGGASANRSAVSAGYVMSGSSPGDWRYIAPWLDSDRQCDVRVTFDGTDVTTIIGMVSIDEDTSTTVRTATLTVLDPRAAFYYTGSIVRGGVAVKIYLWEGNDSYEDEWLAFDGTLEAAGSDDPYCPRASLRAMSKTVALENAVTGSVHILPYSGKTRREIIEAYAKSDETALALSLRVPSTRVERPVDVSGISVQALLQRYCMVEGWYARETDFGQVELLTERQVIKSGPRFDITEDLYLSLGERVPNRPVTVLTVGGSKMPDTILNNQPNPETIVDEQGGIDENGVRWKKVTTTHREWGVEMWITEEHYSDYAIKGMTERTPHFMRTALTRTENEYVWVWVTCYRDGNEYSAHVPTARLASVDVKSYTYYSPPKAISLGILWTDGTTHANTQEYWTCVSHIHTDFEYTGPYEHRPNVLKQKITVVKMYYSPLYHLGGSGLLYDGNVYRANTVYYWAEVGRVIETFFDNIEAMEHGLTATRTTGFTKIEKGYRTTRWDEVSEVLYPRESYETVATESETKSGVPYETYHIRSTATADYRTGVQNYARTHEAGMSPEPEMAAEDVPQFGLETMTYTLTAYPGIFPRVTGSIVIDDAQSEKELIRYARRTMCSAHAVRVSVLMPMVRNLKPWDIVQVWNKPRLYGYTYDQATDTYTRLGAGKLGWIESMRRVADPLNGWHGMELTVALPPTELWKVTT